MSQITTNSTQKKFLVLALSLVGAIVLVRQYSSMLRSSNDQEPSDKDIQSYIRKHSRERQRNGQKQYADEDIFYPHEGGDGVDLDEPRLRFKQVDSDENYEGNWRSSEMARLNRNRHGSSGTKFIAQHRIVHFDLKGAAPRVAYFKKVFKMIHELGGTGVLLEWEDMFPFTGQLRAVAQSQAYSKKDIRRILSWATEFKLDIIPLLQTFGHLEYILKLPQFAKFRQSSRFPQVICLGDEDAVNLVKEAIDQVMSIHSRFPMPFFHMGADEAFQIGMCQLDQKLMKDKLGGSRERLMLRHIANIGKYIKGNYNTTVLMWHDMLNNVGDDMINQYELGSLVEPVVWAYAEDLDQFLNPSMWDSFGANFPNIWGGSSFKGADGPSRYYSNIPHYLKNHISWTRQMSREHEKFTEFRGLILTGWQRFDHFAILCEIFPVGIPSLAVNLKTIQRGAFDETALEQASETLGYSSRPQLQNVRSFARILCSSDENESGPFGLAGQKWIILSLLGGDRSVLGRGEVQGWLSRFNIKHNYSQPYYLDIIMDKLTMEHQRLETITNDLRVEMTKIFWPDTVDEFIYEYIEPDLDRMSEMMVAAVNLGTKKSFQMRPFPIQGSTSQWKGHSLSDQRNYVISPMAISPMSISPTSISPISISPTQLKFQKMFIKSLPSGQVTQRSGICYIAVNRLHARSLRWFERSPLGW